MRVHALSAMLPDLMKITRRMGVVNGMIVNLLAAHDKKSMACLVSLSVSCPDADAGYVHDCSSSTVFAMYAP